LEIIACPKCGSRKILQENQKEDVLKEYTTQDVCMDCGYKGTPIIFDDIEKYKDFLETLKKETKGD